MINTKVSNVIENIKGATSQLNGNINNLYSNMVDPLKKGIKKAKLEVPAIGIVDGVDLRAMPKFICYKSALIKEKILWQNLSFGLLLVLTVLFTVDRFQINRLSKLYREKEYIVLPDYIPVSPHTISDRYVKEATETFLNLLGNINSKSIDRQYSKLTENMNLPLRRRFEEETFEWKEYVKSENITEVLKCGKQEIYSSNDGKYSVTALCKKETYINHEYIGAVDEVIEMSLMAIAPNKVKRWVLNISDIKRTSKKTFKVKSNL